MAYMYGKMKSQKEALGFAKEGYIMICKGETYAYKDWLKEQGARYNKVFGWSFGAGISVPEDLPAGVSVVRVNWEDVGEGENLKPDEQVRAYLDTLIYEPSTSEYQGELGDRLDLTLVVERVVELDGYYGRSNMHIMSDSKGNTFVWTTASKRWETGSEKHIRGTVKDHRTFRNVKQTILTRCTEIQSK